ncbi:inositol 2-dehydrogenase [Rhodobacteraceae bacterium WD3A24]|nr:inositol 2-dehydrogenase [Rhodobacteraceae bacterium WD3A24]
MLQFAILGAGRIGKVHGAAIADTPGAALAAVADPVAEAARSLAQAHDCAVRSIDDIEADPAIDAVVICTPTDTHADLIERFARAGKAIFCEKPIDLSLARVRACLGVVEETGATLMVGFNRRFDPDFRALKARVESGVIGRVEMVTITSRDPAPPPIEYIARSGGIFRDMTIHDFDVARWLLGEEVETVQATGSVLVDPAIGEAGDYDSANVLLTTAGGRQCVITNSRRASYGYDQRLEVHGSDGMVAADNRHEANIRTATAEGIAQPPLLDFFMTRYAEAYRAEIAAFIAAIAEDAPPPATGADGAMALALADAAGIAAREGRSVALEEVTR